MGTRTVTLSDDDLAAIVATRSIIADAAHHSGRAAAIAAIDRLDRLAAGSQARARQLDSANREMAAMVLDRAADLGGVKLCEALDAMGPGFAMALPVALTAWIEVSDRVQGDPATLQRIAAARLRG